MDVNKIFDDYKDVHVANYVIYAYNSKAYKDAAHTTQFTTSELKDVFVKGALVATETGYAKLIGYAESESVGSVSYIVPNGTTATSADIATIAAVADPE